MDILLPIIVLFLATWAGGGVVLLFPSTDLARSKLFLSFSGAYLFGLAITELFPTLFQEGPPGIAGWVLAGFLLQLLLDMISGGIEHGHVQEKREKLGNSFPIALLTGLCVHSLLESIPLGEGNVLESHRFLIGLTLHKIPVSLALGALMFHSGERSRRRLTAFLVFSLMAPFGIFIGYGLPFLIEGTSHSFSYYILALVSGIILHVSTTIIFESSEEHRLESPKLLVVIAGFALAVFF